MWFVTGVLTAATAAVRLASDFVAQGSEAKEMWKYGNEAKGGQRFADLNLTVTPEELEQLNTTSDAAVVRDIMARAQARSVYHKKAGY